MPIARRATKCLVPGASLIYLFNEGTGTTLRDFSGNGYDGTVTGATFGATGLTYDGDNDFAALSALIPALKGATELTIQFVGSTTTSEASAGILAGSTTTNATGIRIRDSTDASGDADSIRVQVTDGSTLSSLDLPGRLTATPELITVRFRGGERLNARKGQSGAWTENTTSIVAALNALETWAALTLARYGTTYRAGADSFLIVYTAYLSDAQVDQNCRAIDAIMAPRGIDIPFEYAEALPPVMPDAVLFTFDNVEGTIYDYAYPIMAAAGLTGTLYATQSYVGAAGQMTLAQYQEMYAAGWDVANHCATHAYLTEMAEEDQEASLASCAAYLVANDMPRGALHVAYPSGAYNADTLAAMAAAGMRTGRTWDALAPVIQTTPIAAPYEIEGVLSLYGDTASGTLIRAKEYLKETTPGKIVTYVIHGVDPDGSGNGGENWTCADFQNLVDYVKTAGCRVVTISELWTYMQAGYVWP